MSAKVLWAMDLCDASMDATKDLQDSAYLLVICVT
jgi:hypothetical protein